MNNDDDTNARIIAELRESNNQLKLMIEQCQKLMADTKAQLETNNKHLEDSRRQIEYNLIVLRSDEKQQN